ncbi:MAG: hypothetical protein V3T31_10540 [candidate division Zixibacteria bacterium]
MSGQGPIDRVTKVDILKIMAIEADGFYRLITTISSAFLGGSLLFLDKISSSPAPWSLYILAVGWLSLVGAILTTVKVRQKNLESGKLALRGNYGEAQQIDRRNVRWANLATTSFILGITAITVFGAVNLFMIQPKKQEEKSMADEKKDNESEQPESPVRKKPATEIGDPKRSEGSVPSPKGPIPFGDLGDSEDDSTDSDQSDDTSSSDSDESDSDDK